MVQREVKLSVVIGQHVFAASGPAESPIRAISLLCPSQGRPSNPEVGGSVELAHPVISLS